MWGKPDILRDCSRRGQVNKIFLSHMQCFYRGAVSTRRDFYSFEHQHNWQSGGSLVWAVLMHEILFELRNQTLSLVLLFISEKEWDEMKDDLI